MELGLSADICEDKPHMLLLKMIKLLLEISGQDLVLNCNCLCNSDYFWNTGQHLKLRLRNFKLISEMR